MAASAAALEYKELFKVSNGGRWLTGTEVKIEGEKEEYKLKGIAISPEKLGLPDGLLDSAFSLGMLDETSAKMYDAIIVKEKLILYASGTATKFNTELSEAEGKALKGYYAVVIAIGR